MLEYRGKPTKIDPVYERDCIVDYVSQTWRVQTNEKSLSDVIDIILAKGIDYGIYYREHDIYKSTQKFISVMNDMAKEQYGEQTTVSNPFTPREGIEYILKFEVQIRELKKELRSYVQTIKPALKSTKKTKFKGTKDNMPLGPTFTEYLQPGWIKYHKERGASNLDIFLMSIFTQGMHFGRTVVFEEYGVLGSKVDQEIGKQFKEYMAQKGKQKQSA